jgi:nucleotide-binding universal stress UspA family protein
VSIVEEARARNFSTIVVGRRGLSRVEEFFIGRVSNKIVHMARDKAVWVVS